MLTIKHSAGPLDGTETDIASNIDRVVFGRQLDCDVVYPVEATLVARRHFALVRKPSGSWTIDLFGGPVVAIDGKAAEQGQVVRSGSRIELGKLGGPSFTTLLDKTTADNYPATEQQQPLAGARTLAERAGQRASGARIVGAAAAVVAVAAVAFGVSQYFSSKSSFAQLNDAVARADAAQGQLAEVSIGKPVRDHLVNAVYKVATQAKGSLISGTAWPVGPHLLATNAHVAEDVLKPGNTTTVQAPGADGKQYAVVGKRVHPSYAAYEAFIAQDVFGLKLSKVNVPANLQFDGYDVALLEIKETLPAEQIFKLAGPDEYKSLHSGQPLATAGYPTEGITGANVGNLRSTPEFHLGSVTGVTNFFFLPADPDHRQLVHMDLPITGGASGSPVVDNKGNVVAIASSGNMFKLKEVATRMPNGALVNYAQRVDMLQALLDRRENETLVSDRVYWQQQISNFSRGLDLITGEFLDQFKPKAVSQVIDKTVTLTEAARQPRKSGGTQRQMITSATLAAGSAYGFIAYGLKMSPLELYVMDGDKIIASDKTNWFPGVKIVPASTDRTLTVAVVSGDSDVTFVLRGYKIDDKSTTK